MEFEFYGKTVLVTGSASGIGLATARSFSAAGARVLGIDVQVDDEKFDTYVTDLTEETDVISTVRAIAQSVGSVDILVNCAGIDGEKPLASLAITDFDKIFAVNVRGMVLVTREVLPLLQTGSRIINVSSELAFLGRAGMGSYCASKGAILSLTRSWARELAPKILVNAVAPGPIETPLLHWDTISADERAAELSNPLGRIGKPEEVASVIRYLASDASSYITGQCISVDGGAAMH